MPGSWATRSINLRCRSFFIRAKLVGDGLRMELGGAGKTRARFGTRCQVWLASGIGVRGVAGAFVGCVLSGPAIKTDLEPGFLQMLVIRFLSTFFPKTGVLQLDASGVSRDPEEVARYVNDPFNYTGKLSARLVAELFRAMGDFQARVADIRLPLLLLHGGADSMASPEGSRFLDANVSSTDKTLNIYPGLYHEIFNEPEREQVFADILVWCEELLRKQET